MADGTAYSTVSQEQGHSFMLSIPAFVPYVMRILESLHLVSWRDFLQRATANHYTISKKEI